MTTIEITNRQAFEKAVSKLNRRAAKLGAQPVNFRYTGKSEVRTRKVRMPQEGLERMEQVTVHEVEISDHNVTLEGWRFAATLTPVGNRRDNLVTARPGEAADLARFHTSGDACEHCGIDRKRNKTFVVQNVESGELKQVGSSCLKDFLPMTGERAVRHFQFASDIAVFLNDPEAGYNSAWTLAYPPAEVLSYGLAACEMGKTYVSSAAAKRDEYDLGTTTISTCQYVRTEIGQKNCRIQPTPETDARAKELLAWAGGQVDENEGSSYWQNVGAMLRADSCPEKGIGYVVGLIGWHNAYTARKAREAAPTPSQALKTGRYTITGTVLSIKEQESAWGWTTKALVQLEDGNKVWGTLPIGKQGDKIEFVARVNVSDRDNHFGFFSRPSKARVLEEAAA